MAKPYIFLMLFSLATIIAHGDDNLLGNFSDQKIRVTKLQVYLQDISVGPTPSVVTVAGANSSYTSPTSFGLIKVIDDPVRTGPTPESEIVARAQGVVIYSSLEEGSIHMSFDIIFTGSQYKGSVLNIVGPNQFTRHYRQLSIVGGAGDFLLARGFIGLGTVWRNATGAFLQYNMTILHYDGRFSSF